MHFSELRKARSYLQGRPLIDSRKDLEKYLEAVITTNGHAWCMDVESERRKMAKLIVEALSSA